ncbi:PREDICTED: F-box/FBD/LRR-repeat protein At1g13570-like [Ipomoea nil]|uniref:F-box/FBD/LRR-repeat protein At1g13570-like n=1 Tax=Ipomoea nil TaxID=35883 RepID=UPI00090186DC|nr:PREDICTED: F-box/FBD/LRR-repeat protein At1g13570-like [Ipomoea nil]
MASRRRKSEEDAGRDVISELPVEVKEMILECLPTRDAARTALLSTHWNEVWLRHGRLVFDKDFLECLSKYEGEKGMALINTINDILMLRAGPIKKFTLQVHRTSDPQPQQCDLDRWCRFLLRNGVQELNLYISRNHKLPSCIFLCRTIKQLSLGGFIFDLPVPSCIFPSVTSLFLENVEFSDNVKEIVYSVPNLEELVFCGCKGITNFEISSTKLERYIVIGSLFWMKLDESRWFTRCLKTIKTLILGARFLLCKDAEIATVTFPTAINLQVIELYDLSVSCAAQFAFVLQLLQNSPNLCQLKIMALDCLCSCDLTMGTRLLEEQYSCIIKQDLKILNTIIIVGFSGVTLEMLFVKMLLSKSPTLERVAIMEYVDTDIEDTSEDVNSWRKELLCFPRASPEAQLVCGEIDDSVFELFDYMWF